MKYINKLFKLQSEKLYFKIFGLFYLPRHFGY